MVSKQEVLDCFEEFNRVILATVDGDKPRLRPVTMVFVDEVFYFATDSSANKVKQLDGNPEIEFILQLKEESNNGYVRVNGKAIKVKEIDTITMLYNKFEYFKMWKSPSDPTLMVYKVEPSMYDYMKPGEFASVLIEIK